MGNDDPLSEGIALLSHRVSGKRRSGAKMLRKLGDVRAGPAILQALQHELNDTRTWEAQYLMVMALGECGYREALPFLRGLASESFWATAIYTAIGDAIVRLSTPIDGGASVIIELIESGNPELAHGAFRAMAMLRLVPTADVIERIMAYTMSFSVPERDQSNRCFWVAAAAPGWLEASPGVRPYLQACTESASADVRDAALKAIQGKYSKWNPA